MSLKADNPTFTGNVTIPEPTEGTDAASKAYADGVGAQIKRGAAVFADEQAKAVVFAQAFADADYRITLAPSGNVATWYTDKTAEGFTVRTGANHTGDVDWVAAHD